ncbi:hypothetical protein L6164_031126 [Bauhinia variegata]|uniref:Uncharacterized protein n=1 Tax=Bauhinia variegata TaxID=167791 RepID=A0ACB9LEZ8_BAUVA|nr:hypothetical protein L6164_031126 [Bauhinia variegata]
MCKKDTVASETLTFGARLLTATSNARRYHSISVARTISLSVSSPFTYCCSVHVEKAIFSAYSSNQSNSRYLQRSRTSLSWLYIVILHLGLLFLSQLYSCFF